MNASELKSLLDRYGIRALKARSQHFLLDEGITAQMADAAGVTKGTRVFEIGPGPGVLTKTLIDRGASVVAAEIDRRFDELLRDRFGVDDGRFVIIASDALTLATSEIVMRFPTGAAKEYALIANLPYSITSATLIKFLSEEPKPKSITLMLQKEVAERILATPKDMSALAVMVQALARAKKICDVPAGSFLPPPKVDSAVIHMEVKTAGDLEAFFQGTTKERYFSLVKQAFLEPRKQIKNTLRAAASSTAELETALKQAKIKPTARPEELTIEDWLHLSRAISGKSPAA